MEPEDRYDRLILWIVKNVPGRGVLALAGLSYLGFGLALPLLLGWPALWIFAANVWGTLFAASLLFGWLFVQIESRDRRHLVEWTSDLRLLDAQEFEWLVGELYRREGWTVTERGRQGGPDGNIDLELRRGSERRIVQAKRWQSWQVSVDDIRGFGGTLLRERHVDGGAGHYRKDQEAAGSRACARPPRALPSPKRATLACERNRLLCLYPTTGTCTLTPESASRATNQSSWSGALSPERLSAQ